MHVPLGNYVFLFLALALSPAGRVSSSIASRAHLCNNAPRPFVLRALIPLFCQANAVPFVGMAARMWIVPTNLLFVRVVLSPLCLLEAAVPNVPNVPEPFVPKLPGAETLPRRDLNRARVVLRFVTPYLVRIR